MPTTKSKPKKKPEKKPPNSISYDEWLAELTRYGASVPTDQEDEEYRTVYELVELWGFVYTEASCHRVRNLLQRARMAGALEIKRHARTAIDGTVRPQPVYRVDLQKLKANDAAAPD